MVNQQTLMQFVVHTLKSLQAFNFLKLCQRNCNKLKITWQWEELLECYMQIKLNFMRRISCEVMRLTHFAILRIVPNMNSAVSRHYKALYKHLLKNSGTLKQQIFLWKKRRSFSFLTPSAILYQMCIFSSKNRFF